MKNLPLPSIITALGVCLITLSLNACSTPGQSAALGAGIGAATGAVVGNQSGRAGEGALLGGAAGLGTGYLLGREKQHRERARYPQDQRYYNDGYNRY